MRTFKISEKIEVVCRSENTRSGFRHLATLFVNGVEQTNTKCCYSNRTWEAYEFQTVLSNVVSITSLSEEDLKVCKAFIDGDQTDWSDFKAVSVVASLGDLFCENQKDKNDWKKRMLKAGLENKGLSIPEDWDSLDEETKQIRLDGAIQVLTNKQIV